MMNSPFKTITGVTLAGMFVLMATHGTAFFASVENAFNFLFAISDKAPLGVASFFLALFAAMLLWLALQKWFKEDAHSHNWWTRSWFIDFVTVLFGILVSWLQLKTSNGMLFGIMAGLAAPHPARWAMALSTWVGNRFRAFKVDQEPQP